MKKLLTSAFIILSISIHSQDVEIKAIDDQEVPFAIIENVPLYPGCDENMGNQAKKQCMSSQISTHIGKNFNLNKIKSLGLPDGEKRILVIFKINTKGEIVDIKASAEHEALEKEAIRVIELLPKMTKAGYQRGKPVIVPYSLPIKFTLVSETLSKKELRKLKRQKKNR